MSEDFEFDSPPEPAVVENDETPKDPLEVQVETKDYQKPIGNNTLSDSIDFTSPSTKNVSYRFSIPSFSRMIILEQLQAANKGVLPQSKTKEFADWNEVVKDASENYTTGGLYQDRFDDSESDFHQGVVKPDGSLQGMSSPKFKSGDGELKGEMAVLKVSKRLGLGEVLSIPLPHSGIVVTLKPPTERDIIDFYSTIFREKVYLGRMSSGLTLTNLSAYINNKLFDFIVKHVHSVNYGDINKDQLKNYVLIHDMHVLAWGFACTMYPNGFEYSRPCTANIEKCNYVSEATINMLKLLWVDNSALTQIQKDILYEVRPAKLKSESYRKFISEHNRVKSRSVTLKDGMKLILKVPTVGEHTSDGLGWVNKINNAIDNILTTDEDSETVKKDMLQQYVSSSVLRQFSHFIDYIEEDENVISDRDTINSVLELLSADDDVRNEISEAILKFTSDTTIALVGIPQFKCPKCGTDQNPDPINDRLTSVIPLDVMMLFFTLLTLRMSRILERQ